MRHSNINEPTPEMGMVKGVKFGEGLTANAELSSIRIGLILPPVGWSLIMAIRTQYSKIL